MIEPLFDTCASCGRVAKHIGAGICHYCGLMKAVTESFDRMRAALRGQIPTVGKRLKTGITRQDLPLFKIRTKKENEPCQIQKP
jgi:ribosomal protein L37E